MRKAISLLFAIGSFTFVLAQDQNAAISVDSTNVNERQFTDEKLENFRADPDFDYGTRPAPELTLWERFKLWFNQLLRSIFYFGTETPWGKLLIYAGSIALIVLVVMRILKVKNKGVFYGASNALKYGALDENIHEMDFPELITEAKSKGDFRSAVRLIFLYALKKLSDSELVAWEPGKTNYEYVEELPSGEIKPHFGELSFYFDYAWYGDFKIDEAMMNKVEGIFSQFDGKIEAR